MLIDTHAHLLDARFDADRQETLSRAAGNGVARIIEVACDPAQWDAALELCARTPQLRCVLGIHPQDARLATPELMRRLAALGQQAAVVGIGETGLDYHYENSPRDVQKAIFSQTLEIAQALHKPVVIHCREAYDDMMVLLRSRDALPSGVIHCFSGSIEQAQALLAMRFYLGVDGPVTYPSAKALKAVVREIPLDRLVLETDSPYLPPQKFRGARNEPSYLPLIAQEVAAARGIGIDEVVTTTGAAAQALFT